MRLWNSPKQQWMRRLMLCVSGFIISFALCPSLCAALQVHTSVTVSCCQHESAPLAPAFAVLPHACCHQQDVPAVLGHHALSHSPSVDWQPIMWDHHSAVLTASSRGQSVGPPIAVLESPLYIIHNVLRI